MKTFNVGESDLRQIQASAVGILVELNFPDPIDGNVPEGLEAVAEELSKICRICYEVLYGKATISRSRQPHLSIVGEEVDK